MHEKTRMTIVKALYVAIAVRARRPPETVVATVLALAILMTCANGHRE